MRDKIIETATEMFLNFGFKSVTMDDIANELSISKKTIYQHFCNKHDLVEASTLSVFETVSCGIDDIREMKKNSIEEIFIIRSFMMQHLNNESASPFYQLQKFFPKIFSCLRTKQLEKVNGCMVDNLQRGIDNGLYRSNINIDFISRIYFTGLTGIKDQDIYPAAMFNMSDLTKQFLEYHLRGIVTAKGQEVLEKLLESDKIKLT